MLENIKAQQAAAGRKEITRLAVFVAASLAVAGGFISTSQCQRTEPEVLPIEDAPPRGKVEPPVEIDRARVAAVGDSTAAHSDSSYEKGALDDLLKLVDRPLAERPRRIGAEELAALPFADAAGHVFEVRGTVVEIESQQFRTDQRRLWSLVLEGTGGGRVLALKQGLASDPGEGAPRDVYYDPFAPPEPVKEGESVLVRGIYLQRRTGTIGTTKIPDPIPVLVATAFRHSQPPVPPPADLSQIEWNQVEDRFLAETKNLEEPALYQTLQWARQVGHEKIEADLLSGALPWKDWDKETFETWSKEIGVKDRKAVRPFTDAARGKVWRFTGIVGALPSQIGWSTVSPHLPYGVDDFWLLHILPDHYTVWGNSIALRTFLPFDPDVFRPETTALNEQVTAYGVFVKNYTYETRRASKDGTGTAPATVPVFVVLHLDPVTRSDQPYRSFMVILCATMVFLGFLFWWVLIRGEKKEARRLEEYRVKLRKQMRAVGQGPVAGGPPPGRPPRDEPPEDGPSTA